MAKRKKNPKRSSVHWGWYLFGGALGVGLWWLWSEYSDDQSSQNGYPQSSQDGNTYQQQLSPPVQQQALPPAQQSVPPVKQQVPPPVQQQPKPPVQQPTPPPAQQSLNVSPQSVTATLDLRAGGFVTYLGTSQIVTLENMHVLNNMQIAANMGGEEVFPLIDPEDKPWMASTDGTIITAGHERHVSS